MSDDLREIATVLRALVDELREPRAELLAPIMAHPDADPALTLDQAVLYTGLHAKTLRTDALAGKLTTVRRTEGGHLRCRLSDLNQYLDNQRRGPVTGRARKTDDIDWGA